MIEKNKIDEDLPLFNFSEFEPFVDSPNKEKLNKRKGVSRPFRGKRWAVTLDGWDKADLNALKAYFDTDAVLCACISAESGKNKCHPHWQIYFELVNESTNIRLKLIEILGHKRAHIEAALGTKEANVAYVYGIKKDWEGGFIRYAKNVEVPKTYNPVPSKFWDNFVPRPFQQDVINIARTEPDRRTIYWFWEPEGNTGKTRLAEYLHIFHAAIITGGKSADMKHAVVRWTEIAGQTPTIIIADICRSDEFTKDGAKAIEGIKNGLFFDGKYESAMMHSYVKPHVFCFSNEAPDKSLMSNDRWKIYKIVNWKLVPQFTEL